MLFCIYYTINGGIHLSKVTKKNKNKKKQKKQAQYARLIIFF